MLVQLQLRAPKVPVQEGAGALEAPAVLVQGVHSASWCTVLCGAGHMCGRGAPARCTHVARRARSTLSHNHIQLCYRKRWVKAHNQTFI